MLPGIEVFSGLGYWSTGEEEILIVCKLDLFVVLAVAIVREVINVVVLSDAVVLKGCLLCNSYSFILV